jgi:hypothetical protein
VGKTVSNDTLLKLKEEKDVLAAQLAIEQEKAAGLEQTVVDLNNKMRIMEIEHYQQTQLQRVIQRASSVRVSDELMDSNAAGGIDGGGRAGGGGGGISPFAACTPGTSFLQNISRLYHTFTQRPAED